jgi:hypothetical protein
MQGVYSFSSDTVEDWEKVINDADRYEHLESLKGWDPYTECYKVYFNGDINYYFVAMPRW